MGSKEINPLYDIENKMEGNRYSLYSLAFWKNGLAFKNIHFSETGKPIIKIAELNNGISDNTAYSKEEFSSDVHLTKGDLVFAWSGNPDTSIDIFRYNLPDGWLNQHIFKVVPNSSIVEKDYFFYIMKYLKPNFKKIARNKQTTGLGHVTIADLQKLNLTVPPLVTQRKIASILRDLDSKIELNDRIIANLEEQAKSIYKSWFIDFDLSDGEIPNNWRFGELSEIIEYNNGYAFNSKKMLKAPTSTSIKIFKQGHIARGGGFIFDGTKSWIEKSELSKLDSKYFLKRSDILMAMTDMKDNVAILGNTALMPVDNEYVVNQRVALLRPKNKMGISYPYLYITTNYNHEFLKELRAHANSGVQVNLSSEAIRQARLLIPDFETNVKFNELVKPMLEKCMDLQIQNNKLASVRNTLLPKLMSGEIDVDAIDL